MIRYENDCCGCAVPGYPCIGDACKFRNVPHFYCDLCGAEVSRDELFQVDDDQMCEECAKANISYAELLEEVYGTVEEV